MVSIPYIHVTRYHFLPDIFVLLLLMNVGQLNLVPRKIKKVLKTKSSISNTFLSHCFDKIWELKSLHSLQVDSLSLGKFKEMHRILPKDHSQQGLHLTQLPQHIPQP